MPASFLPIARARSLPVRAIVMMMLICLCSVRRSVAHGVLMKPASRNLLNPANNCPQCSSAGGVGTLQANGGKHGLAGDPWDEKVPRSLEAGGQFWKKGLYSTVVQGSVLDMEVLTTTNHAGRFEFRICRIDGSWDDAPAQEAEQLTEECLDRNQLVQANVAGAQQPGERFFHATPGDPDVKRYYLHYQLPEELICDGVDSHCVLQWQWQTLHGCKREGWPDEYALGKSYGYCGDSNNPSIWSEWFYNVADLAIVPPGSDAAAGAGLDRLSTGEAVTKTFWHPSLQQYYDQE